MNYLTRALFLEARMLDLTSLAGVIAPSAASLDSYFVQNYLRLVADGRVLTSQDGFGGKRETPYAFDLRRDRPFSAHGSLRTILQQYLASAASNSAKRAALAATRVLLSLNAHAATAAVMKAAANVPFQALHGLPERFMVEATSAAKLQKKTIAIRSVRSVRSSRSASATTSSLSSFLQGGRSTRGRTSSRRRSRSQQLAEPQATR